MAPRPGAAYSAPAGSVAPRVPESTPWSDDWSERRSYPAREADAGVRSQLWQQRNRPTVQPSRGLAAWIALAILVVVAAGAGVVDYERGLSSGGLFGWGLVAGSLIAIILVRRGQMFPVVIAPPIVYIGGKLAASLLRHQDLASRKGAFDVATNWFVYGFPAMAAATAIVLLVAGLRLMINR